MVGRRVSVRGGGGVESDAVRKGCDARGDRAMSCETETKTPVHFQAIGVRGQGEIRCDMVSDSGLSIVLRAMNGDACNLMGRFVAAIFGEACADDMERLGRMTDRFQEELRK